MHDDSIDGNPRLFFVIFIDEFASDDMDENVPIVDKSTS